MDFFFFGEGACVCLPVPFSLLSIFYLWLFSLLVFLIFSAVTDSEQQKIHRKINTSL